MPNGDRLGRIAKRTENEVSDRHYSTERSIPRGSKEHYHVVAGISNPKGPQYIECRSDVRTHRLRRRRNESEDNRRSSPVENIGNSLSVFVLAAIFAKWNSTFPDAPADRTEAQGSSSANSLRPNPVPRRDGTKLASRGSSTTPITNVGTGRLTAKFTRSGGTDANLRLNVPGTTRSNTLSAHGDLYEYILLEFRIRELAVLWPLQSESGHRSTTMAIFCA